MFSYGDEYPISIDNTELNIVSRPLQSKAEAIVRRFCDNAMEVNPGKFQGIYSRIFNKPVMSRYLLMD